MVAQRVRGADLAPEAGAAAPDVMRGERPGVRPKDVPAADDDEPAAFRASARARARRPEQRAGGARLEAGLVRRVARERSVGAQGQSRVARVFERARFVYLRDEQSAEKLRRCGVRRELHVAPDLVVLLGGQLEREAEAAKGRALLEGFAVDTSVPVLCFQSMPYPGFDAEEVARQLARWRADSWGEVVLLPLGRCHGDAEFLRSVLKAPGGDYFTFADVGRLSDAVSVIAACDLFVGTSLHGNVTAFSFGIPHLQGPLPADKAEGFLHSVGLPASLKLASWGELNDKIDEANGLGAEFFASRAVAARLKVTRAVDALLDALLG